MFCSRLPRVYHFAGYKAINPLLFILANQKKYAPELLTSILQTIIQFIEVAGVLWTNGVYKIYPMYCISYRNKLIGRYGSIVVNIGWATRWMTLSVNADGYNDYLVNSFPG